MKLNLPKITQAIPLADYAPELAKHDDGSPAVVQAWINPPAPLLVRHANLRQRITELDRQIRGGTLTGDPLAAAVREMTGLGEALAALFAAVWSQHADPATHWTAADVMELAANDANPALFGWLTNGTIAAINKYRSGLRKN